MIRTRRFSRTRYTFSIWAFPEERYAETLREYFAFAQEYYRAHGYRPNMPHVGYRIEQDTAALSYTYGGAVLTSTPSRRGTGLEGVPGRLQRVLQRARRQPLLNQTWGLKPHHMRKAFGDRVDSFEEIP